MLKLILVRHTETKWNKELRYIGRTDLELTEAGLKNAALLAKHLENKKIDRVYSSDMRRAKQTAKAIADLHDLPVDSLPELNEVDFGDWEGLTHVEISEKYNGLIDSWLADPLHVQIPKGETWTAFERRVHIALEKIIDNTRGAALVVTHGGPIKVIIGAVLRIPPSSYWQIYQDKGAINIIKFEDNRPRVALLNDTCYRKQI